MQKENLSFGFSNAALKENGSDMSKHSPESTQFPHSEVYQVRKRTPSTPLCSNNKLKKKKKRKSIFTTS